MRIGRINGATRTFVRPDDWDEAVHGPCDPLAIRDEVIDGLPCMTSAWFPTDEQLQRMCEGAPLYLTEVGHTHSIVALGVGPVDHQDGRPAG